MKVAKPISDPNAHNMERTVETLASSLASPWNGPAPAPGPVQLLQLCNDSFEVLWTTARQTGDAATVVRAVSQFGGLHLSASKGRHALSLNVRDVLSALTGILRPGALDRNLNDAVLPPAWDESLRHNARCLVLTVDLMHAGNLTQDDAYRNVLENQASAMQILAYARDEAHRSANTLRIKLGQRRTLTSELDAIRGVGDKTRSRLLKQLGSLRAVRAANEAELIAAGASRKQAQAIRAAFDATPAPRVLPRGGIRRASHRRGPRRSRRDHGDLGATDSAHFLA